MQRDDAVFFSQCWKRYVSMCAQVAPAWLPACLAADKLLHKALAEVELAEQLRKEATGRVAEGSRRALELERRLREAEEASRAAGSRLVEAQEEVAEAEARTRQLQEQLAGGGGVHGWWWRVTWPAFGADVIATGLLWLPWYGVKSGRT